MFGTQHVLTFDSQTIDFNSDCEFALVDIDPPTASVSAKFSITLKNKYKYSNIDSVSQADCVEMTYLQNTVLMCADQSAIVSRLILSQKLLLDEDFTSLFTKLV